MHDTTYDTTITTSLITTSLLINSLPHKQICWVGLDVTAEVTPTMASLSHLRASEKEEWALMQEPSYMRIPRPIYNKYEEREREDEKK